MAAELTPMMRQYLAIKREVPVGAIVMFRLGDFYEMFGEDAITASPILGATLTHRGDQPMCGVPYHAINSYLAKLIRAGKTAALCDQVEDPKTAKGLVRREITRIVTPGTVTEDGLLDETTNTYIAATAGLGLALLDLSTGEFIVEKFATEAKLAEALERYHPAEMLASNDENRWTFALDVATETLTRHLKVLSLDGFGLTGESDLVSAAGALLYYVGTTLHHSLAHVRKLQFRKSGDELVLDSGSIRHLQLLPVGEIPKAATLLGVLDVTKTPMGARTLRNWIQRPMASSAAINARLDAVETFVQNRAALASVRALLAGVRDLERLMQKVDSRRANPRDLKGLAASLRPIPEIVAALPDPSSFVLRAFPELVALVDSKIVEDPPILLTDGGFIASGADAELDDLRKIATEGHRWLAEFQAREQTRTGIAKLKVKHVPAFGFLIEIPKSFVAQVPEDYIRRQTLTTGERYVTPELKEYEQKVLGATEKAIALEQKLYQELLTKIALETEGIQETARVLGLLDATLALADRALAAGYVRPVVDDSDVLEIEDGRHPIIEQLPDAEPFVPNSAFLNTTTDQIILITGPNMAGKSTYIRQVATIAIMAQMGSFVPASSMRLGALDRVFTRIGAGDDLARGRSTFLVEMQETANILNNATPKSLIVLDEIGRGTSTFDGISIAWSVAEYLHGKPQAKAKTLFATHYHELTDLADIFPGVKNYTVKVKDEGGRVIFLRRIVPGIAEKSFGIHVGAMAGLPQEVVQRASEILKNLESNDLSVTSAHSTASPVRKPRKRLSEFPGQMTFFLLGLVAMLLTGCSTDLIHRMTRHDAAEITDFLPGKERLERRPDTFPVHYSWMDTNAVMKANFQNVYIAPFDVSYLRKGNGYDELRDKAVGLDDAITDLGEYGRKAMIQAFVARADKTHLKVVDDPSLPHTAIWEFAITSFVPTRAEVEVAGVVGSFFCPIPGVGLVADYLAAGEIAIECRVRDSATQEVVLMFADAEGEPKALLQLAKYTYTSAAKINLKRLATQIVESCIVDDASKLRRDFPVSFVIFPWEGELQ